MSGCWHLSGYLTFYCVSKFPLRTHARSGHANSAQRDKSDAPLSCSLRVPQSVTVDITDGDTFLDLPAIRFHVMTLLHVVP